MINFWGLLYGSALAALYLCVSGAHKRLIMGHWLPSLGFWVKCTHSFRSSNGLFSPVTFLLTRSQISSDNSWQWEAVCLTEKRSEQSDPRKLPHVHWCLCYRKPLPSHPEGWYHSDLSTEPEQLLWSVQASKTSCAHRGAPRSHRGHKSTQPGRQVFNVILVTNLPVTKF